MKLSEIRIETGIQLPPDQRQKESQWAVFANTLRNGDSFVVPKLRCGYIALTLRQKLKGRRLKPATRSLDKHTSRIFIVAE